jgi:deoxyribodipyrimidine photolyase-related protein
LCSTAQAQSLERGFFTVNMPKQKTLRLILGDQLNELHSWFQKPDKNVSFVLMEIRQ